MNDDICTNCYEKCELAYTGAPYGLCCTCWNKDPYYSMYSMCPTCKTREKQVEYIKKATIPLTEFVE